MPTDQTERLANLVASALDCAVAERAQFLSDVCGDDIALREEAESLLRFEENARDFIETPAYDLAPQMVADRIDESVSAPEPVFENEATVDFVPELQVPEIERGDAEEIFSEGVEPPPAPEPIFQSPEIERYESEEILNGADEPPPSPELIFPSERTETVITEESILESEPIEAVITEESILEREPTEAVITEEPILESEPTEAVIIEESILEREPTEAVITEEPILEREPTEAVITEEPILESEPTEAVITEESILESEPTEAVLTEEPIIEREPTEAVIAEEPILESAVGEPITAQGPVFESAAIEPEVVQKPMVRKEGTTLESGPEFRSLEIDRSDRDDAIPKPVSPEPEQEPKPESAAHSKSAPQPRERKNDSFIIPPASERTPSLPAKSVWWKRGTTTVLAGLAVVLAIMLTSALQNAKNAQRQRDVAEKERSRAERINSYLQQILSFSDQNFTSVWPIPHNRNTTVTEMLDRVAPRVQKELAGQPDVRGEVLRMIGKTYAAQGDHEAAEKNLRAALQAQTAFYGEQNAEITETLVDLGILLYRREKFAEAEEFLEKGVTFLRKQHQTQGGRFNAVKLAHALDRLGSVKFYRGDVKAGRAVLEEALDVATQAQPEARERAVLTHIKTDLGGLLVLVGELTKGERLLQEALSESRTAPNAPQWETGETLQMLGELALARNHASEAEENFVAAEDIYRKTLGEKNLYFARNLERRATVSLIENDLPTAEGLARKSLALTKECSPTSKLPWTDPMMTLSGILLKEGRDAEGEDYLRKTIRICEEQPAPNYAAIALAKIRLSQLLLAQKRFTEAENLAFEAHNQTHAHLELQDTMRKAATNNLIEIYEVQEKHAAARAVK